MAHYVITGGAGFIGSHLCERYLKEGHEVTAIDNFLTGLRSNIRELEKNKNFTFIDHDVSKPLPFQKIKRADFVLHFACPASPVDFQKIPEEILHVDSIGTFNTLELAKRDNSRFLIASTSEIYG